MAIRTGSLSRELAQVDPDLLAQMLEDYVSSKRRDRTSRLDFAMGWLARHRRSTVLEGADTGGEILKLPW